MKKLFILLTIFPLTVFCQDLLNEKNNYIGFTFSPDYCYRKLKADPSERLFTENRDTLEIPKFGFSTGVNLLFAVSKRITFETGLLYSDKGYKTKSYSVTWITNPGIYDPSLPEKITNIYHYTYVDVPFRINYYMFRKRTKFFISAGASVNFFLSQRTTSIFEYKDESTKQISSSGINGFSDLNPAYIFGFGISYDLSDKLFLKIEPVYRRSIISVIDAAEKEYLYSAGINFGIYYKLKERKK